MPGKSTKPKAKKAVTPLGSIYQIEVTLMDVEPPVWRRLLVPGTIKLESLHTALQIAMGWTDSHLHQFIAGNVHYGILDEEFESDNEDESLYRLNQLTKKVKDSIYYEYDFGDGWQHKIVLEKILPYEKDMQLPQCLAGERACPPEDCGGAFGYADFLEVIMEPSHPEHESMLEWAGGDFDPEHFDLKETNLLLKKYCR